MKNNENEKWAEKQFTQEEAIEISNSGEWKTWDAEKKVRIQLFQGRLCMPFTEFHGAITDVLGRPVYTHEFAYRDELVKEYLGAKPMPSFEEIVNLIPEEKRIIIQP